MLRPRPVYLMSSLAFSNASCNVGSMDGPATFLVTSFAVAVVVLRGAGRAAFTAVESVFDVAGAAVGVDEDVPAGFEIR